MTNKTYRLYPKAIEDIESIYLYSTSEFGIKRTEDYILAIEASFRQLAAPNFRKVVASELN